ncbi:hypothetical protein B4166_0088 [Caldibacillus thermoamylovorans]|nr:hypothetical protein B4166_0088 [Caldibacillus thermoamylovorans]
MKYSFGKYFKNRATTRFFHIAVFSPLSDMALMIENKKQPVSEAALYMNC